jgi:hypothetical protein
MNNYLLVLMVSLFTISCSTENEINDNNSTSKLYKRLYDDAIMAKYGYYPRYDPSADNYYPQKSRSPAPHAQYENKYPNYEPDADNPPIPNRQFQKPLFSN